FKGCMSPFSSLKTMAGAGLGVSGVTGADSCAKATFASKTQLAKTPENHIVTCDIKEIPMVDSKKKKTSGNPMWGGGFTHAPAELLTKINASIGFDKRLSKQDTERAIAHARMLGRQKIFSRADAKAIVDGLEQ